MYELDVVEFTHKQVSDSFPVHDGLKQGDVLSRLLLIFL